MGNFDDAVKAQKLDEIRQILTIQREEYDKWGRWPTALEVLAILLGQR